MHAERERKRDVEIGDKEPKVFGHHPISTKRLKGFKLKLHRYIETDSRIKHSKQEKTDEKRERGKKRAK
jgi:hypothetical protein